MAALRARDQQNSFSQDSLVSLDGRRILRSLLVIERFSRNTQTKTLEVFATSELRVVALDACVMS